MIIGWYSCGIFNDRLFSDLPDRVINVLAYDPDKKHYYGLTKNLHKIYLRSKAKQSPLVGWKKVNRKTWKDLKASKSSLITATEVPFVPVSPGDGTESYDAFLMQISASKRKRRSNVNYHMWGGI